MKNSKNPQVLQNKKIKNASIVEAFLFLNCKQINYLN